MISRHLINSTDLNADRIKTNSIKSNRAHTKDLTVKDLLSTDRDNELIRVTDLEVTGTLTMPSGFSTVFTSTSDNLVQFNAGGAASSNDAGWYAEMGSLTSAVACIYDNSASRFRLLESIDITTTPVGQMDLTGSSHADIEANDVICNQVTSSTSVSAVDITASNDLAVTNDITSSTVSTGTLTSSTAFCTGLSSIGSLYVTGLCELGSLEVSSSTVMSTLTAGLTNVTALTAQNNITNGDIDLVGTDVESSGFLRLYSNTSSTNSVGFIELGGTTLIGGNTVAFRSNSTSGSAGNTRLTLLASGQLAGEDGSTSVPTYSYDNDATSGLYLESNNTVGICTDSTERVTIGNNLTRVYTDFRANEVREDNPRYMSYQNLCRIADGTLSDNTWVNLTKDTSGGVERIDFVNTDQNGISFSSGNFSFGESGKYEIELHLTGYSNNTNGAAIGILRLVGISEVCQTRCQISVDDINYTLHYRGIKDLTSGVSHQVELQFNKDYASSFNDANLSVYFRRVG